MRHGTSRDLDKKRKTIFIKAKVTWTRNNNFKCKSESDLDSKERFKMLSVILLLLLLFSSILASSSHHYKQVVAKVAKIGK